jgi:hypothetical protein
MNKRVIGTGGNWPTLDEVRAHLWETTQLLYRRIGHLEGTLIGIRDQLAGHEPNIPHLIAKIDAALKEPK